MLSKCANPYCSTPFVYLREGKIFIVESGSQPTGPHLAKSQPATRVEHFWLCGRCATEMTVKPDRPHGIKIVSKPGKKRARAAAS